MQQAIVEVRHVGLIYQEIAAETPAVCDLSFSISDGEFVAIVGPSGCGKTTVLSLLMGLIRPTGGEISIMGDSAGANQSTGYMLQRDHLLDWRTVEENVLLGLEVKGMCTPERRAHAIRLLERYGLLQFRAHYPRALSGGMRQKVALIRTLAFDPELLLLDEPFSALDYQTRLRLSDEMSTIIKSEHKTAVLVTHDIAEAVSMSDRVLVFSERPARLKSEYAIDLPRSATPLARRNDPRFANYFNTIWKELSDYGA